MMLPLEAHSLTPALYLYQCDGFRIDGKSIEPSFSRNNLSRYDLKTLKSGRCVFLLRLDLSLVDSPSRIKENVRC
jgi:hypothetical protein